MIIINLNLDKIEDRRVIKGKKGTYVDLVLFENKNGRDEFNQDGFVSVSVSKEARESGDRGEIVGNWKDTDRKDGDIPKQRTQAPMQKAPARQTIPDAPEDDIPF